MSEDDGQDLPAPGQEESPLFDAGDPAAVKRRRVTAKMAERDAERFWNAIFASEVGRREMFKLLRDCNAFGTEFACGPNGFPQPEATWFKAGIADWGKRMRDSWLVAHTEMFALMLRENDPRFKKDSK